MGQGMQEDFRHFLGENALSIDSINIEPLDDLHQPEGIIAEAQRLAARAFSADVCLFSVQGTSTAIMAMIMSVCNPGDKILVPRNIHKSILAALILGESHPIFLPPAVDTKFGIAHGVSTRQVDKALREHPDLRAVLIIHPTYYGITGDLAAIAQCVHQYDIPLLVDEAHGAHTYFHPLLPCSAMEAGADMAATSLHKLGGSLTQSSLLNIRTQRIDLQRVKTLMSLLTTTSTSYLLLASIDCARQQLALRGKQLLDQALYLAQQARLAINKIPGLQCMDARCLDGETAYAMDGTKLLIHLGDLDITGIGAERWLRTHHNIEVELSDRNNLLCFVTWADTIHSMGALVNGLHDLARCFYTPHRKIQQNLSIPSIPELVLSPREALFSPSHSVPLAKASGCISTETISIYPPGIPVLLPGERITTESIQYIITHLREGYHVQGSENLKVEKIKITK